ncbi:MAG TPA: ArsA family ATPase [Solirubrobacteraceae bacterium]|nr:ArsA family ATPase [Solirubrobacteraceae bacterium]
MSATTATTATLIFTGKGGVGKTTVAASTAVHLADRGLRTLVISTDPAHSLGDCLQVGLDSTPLEIAPDLHAMELDTREEMATRFASVRDVLVKQMAKHGVESAVAEELVNFPGGDELFGLLKLAEVKASNEFDAIVVDTAPTGNTLRFLHFPEFLAPVRRALRIDQAYTRTIRPFASIFGRELPRDDFFESVFALFDAIESARLEFLSGRTYFRFVLAPEKLAVVETQRAVSFLNVSGYTVDALVVNKIIPPGVHDPLFRTWQQLHAEYLAETQRTFYPLRVFEVPLFGSEVLGLSMLRRVADVLYADVDPLARLTEHQLFGLERDERGFVMRVQLPALEASDVQLFKDGDQITIELGGYERRLHCPELLVSRDVVAAEREGNVLAIRFGEEEQAAA